MRSNIQAIRYRLQNETWKPSHKNRPLFAGADLIISDHPVSCESAVIVTTKFAVELSSIIYDLKEACQNQLDSLNKYLFYPALGEAANRYLNSHPDDLTGLLLAVVDRALELDFL